MKSIKLRLTGTSPLLHSSDRLADPLDPATIAHKQLTSKKKKTEDDYVLIARSQWEGLMYWDDSMGGAYMPTANIRASMIGGAKLNKLGMQVKRGVMIMENKVDLKYGKKLTKNQLWDQRFVDRRSVVIGAARVMAYRPKFMNWSVETEILYDENTLDESNILQAMDNAGMYIGIGGYRPEKGGNFGRFTVEVIK